MDDQPQNLFAKVKDGNRRALARAITILEDQDRDRQKWMAALTKMDLPHPPHSIGITGSPGVGKSTFISALIQTLRKDSKRVAILATDPTSPFSGGAILGDRIRMAEHGLDEGVFIRSLASRGNPDGLSTAIPYILKTLGLYGVDHCILETVGSGQLDVLIKAFVDATVLILSPEGGDEIQMMKAGILEIADIMVINKSDRKGVEHLEMQLRSWLDLLPKTIAWRPPIIRTEAINGKGLDEVYEAIQQHQKFCTTEADRSTSFSNREIDHLKFLTINLAVSMFRNRLTELIDTPKLQATLKKTPVDVVEVANLLLSEYKRPQS